MTIRHLPTKERNDCTDMKGKRMFITDNEEHLILLMRQIKFGHIQNITVQNGEPVSLENIVQRVDLNKDRNFLGKINFLCSEPETIKKNEST